MNVDISIKISNYVSTDTYKVNIYKKGSAIPLFTKDVAVGGGDTVIFKLLSGDNDYDGEVIHICTDGTITPLRKAIYTKNASCNCPTGYIVNNTNNGCIKIVETAVTVNGTTATTRSSNKHENYSIDGLRVFAAGFPLDGQGATVYESGNAHTYWASFGDTTKGRMNIAGRWLATLPNPSWNVGFSYKFDVAVAQTYYLGIGYYWYGRIKLNGVAIVDQVGNGYGPSFGSNYRNWNCYPVYLKAGPNIVEFEVVNTTDAAGVIAAEIYKCTLADLQNVTPGTENILNRVFTTKDLTPFTTNYTCPQGYALDASNLAAPSCKQIQYAICI